jgi:PTS system mannose-specific IIC component
MEWIVVCLIAAALVMDTTAAFQVLISQPLISCSVIGYYLGDLQFGLQVGLLTQLLWIGSVPVGAAVIPAGNPASAAAAIVAIQLKTASPELGNFHLMIALIYALFLSYIGAKMIKQNHNWNVWLFNKALNSVKEGKNNPILMINFGSLILQFLATFAAIFTAAYGGGFIFTELVNVIPVEWNTYSRYVLYAAIGSGGGFILSYYTTLNDIRWLLSGFLIAAIFVFI